MIAPAWRRPKGVRIAPGCVVTAEKRRVLAELHRSGERGSCAFPVVMPGGTLAALRMFGLAEHAPDLDGLGGRRYRVSPAGAAFLERTEPMT